MTGYPWQCTYISGPCVDGTQAGKRCTAEAVKDGRCARHERK